MDGELMDEPTTVQQQRMQNRRTKMQEMITARLGQENCQFGLFDLETQLGVCYTNPETGKRWAQRLRHDADEYDVDWAVNELRNKTGSNPEGADVKDERLR